MHLTLWYIVFVCHQDFVSEDSIGSVYIGGCCGLSKSGLCVFRKLCPVGFLVVCECSSLLVKMFAVVLCLALWLVCLCLVIYGLSCKWHL